tara:strand:- start:731 stop:919 length:189 start_codon:yes stop_codon:yes gene_type:complete
MISITYKNINNSEGLKNRMKTRTYIAPSKAQEFQQVTADLHLAIYHLMIPVTSTAYKIGRNE